MKTWFAALAMALTAIAQPVSAQTFSNTDAIAIPDAGETYSPINVSGTVGRITGMSLTLNNISHSYAHDLVFGLFNSTLGVGFVFMSSVGGAAPVDNVTLTFADHGGMLPSSYNPYFDVTSGTYSVANYEGFGFPGYLNATAFSDFNGLSADGAWMLVATDIGYGDVGVVAGGWSLDFTTDGGTSVPGVPEPASWAMMIGGFGIAGTALRGRRKRSLQSANA